MKKNGEQHHERDFSDLELALDKSKLAYLDICVLLQVDFVIKEATNLDNLAQLYEGWTAWV